MAPASPVFAGMPAPTDTAAALKIVVILWERVYPRRIQLGAWHRLCRCSRVNPLPQVLRLPWRLW